MDMKNKTDNRHRKTHACLDCKIPCDRRAKRCKSCARLFSVYELKIPAIDDQILGAYYGGESIQSISKLTGIGETKINKIINGNGSARLGCHKYEFDDSFLFQETHAKYWFLGLMATDGWISMNRNSKVVGIALQKSDQSTLDDIRRLFKTEKPLTESWSNGLSFQLYSEQVFDLLKSHGITERKSHTLKVKNIPEKFYLAFLKGVFDGDGWISKPANGSIGAVCGVSEDFIKQIVEMHTKLGFSTNISVDTHKKKSFAMLYSVTLHLPDAYRFLSEAYALPTPFIGRKYEIFINRTRLTNEEYYSELANIVSSRSSCVRAKVGCVIVNESTKNIVSMGYNGQAAGKPNTCKSSFPGMCGCCHSEANALNKGVDVSDCTLYCNKMPCMHCTAAIITAGIGKVIYLYGDNNYWAQKARKLMRSAGVEIKCIQRRRYDWKLDLMPQIRAPA